MNNNIEVTIMIPCYNEEKYIAACIDSIINNDYPKSKLELIIVDGMSKDKTQDIIKSYIAKHPFIKLLENPQKIVPYALNKAIHEAKGEYIIRMDAHSEYPNNYISELIKYHKELNADNVGGAWDILPGGNTLIAEAIAIATASPFGVGNALYRIKNNKTTETDTVPFGCYKKETFDKIGVFDTDLKRNQDDEFNARLIQSGGKIFLIPSIRIKYKARPDIPKIAKMFYQYAIYKPLVNKKLKHPATIRQFIPPLFVLYLLLLIAVSLFMNQFILFALIPGMIYLTGNIFFSIKESITNNKLKVLPLLPLIFFIVHLSYGAGYLIGLIKHQILRT